MKRKHVRLCVHCIKFKIFLNFKFFTHTVLILTTAMTTTENKLHLHKHLTSSSVTVSTCWGAESTSSSSSSSSPISNSVYLPACALKLSRCSHLFFVLSWNFFLKSATASFRLVGPLSALAPGSPYHSHIKQITNITDSSVNITLQNLHQKNLQLAAPTAESIVKVSQTQIINI